jgi:hypothetical protein
VVAGKVREQVGERYNGHERKEDLREENILEDQ